MGFKSRKSRKSRESSGAPLFTSDTIQFLADLRGNNERDWFNANKDRYERDVREPALELIRRMRPAITSISKHYVAVDKKVGGSLMRIYRDTRFGSDKTPYKTNIGIQFRHRAAKDAYAPGFYLHISLDECFVAAGTWRPEPASLAAIRHQIVTRPAAWKAARDAGEFRRHFELGGQSLTRLPRGFSPGDPHPDDLRRKDHIASSPVGLDEVIGDGLVALCSERFAAATPYLRFLSRAVGAPF